MAINPPSDIVLDVARAADPARYKAAVERLVRLGASSAADAAPPARPAGSSDGSAAATFATSIAREQDAPSAGFTPAQRRELDTFGQFEAFVLQSFIQSMLPKNAPGAFGKGLAGEYWKSMLAEKLGTEIARSGQVGIAQRLASREAPMPATGAAAAAPPSSALLGALAYMGPVSNSAGDGVTPSAEPEQG